ncbi:MAG: SPFH domain-containing protein [Spirochaetaceae bacterium]|nr:SPFH domain-containing protein [Spirochaetaceae bacterium]
MRNESFVTFIVVAIILLVVIFSAFSIVGPTERGIKVTLGVADEEVLGPGLKIKAPFFQKIQKYDLTPIQYQSSFSSVSDAAITLDKQSILVNFELFWRYDESKLYNVATRYKSKESLYQPISTSLKGIIKDCVGKKSINEITANQSQLTNEVRERLVDEIAYLPIIVDKFTITNIDWSEEYDRQIEETAKLSQQVEQAKQQALIVEAQAQKQVKEAQARLEAEKLNAEAEIAKAEGEAKAKKIRADADAYEAQKIAENQAAYSKQWQYEIDLEKAKRWNGKEVPDAAYIVPGSGAVVPLTVK